MFTICPISREEWTIIQRQVYFFIKERVGEKKGTINSIHQHIYECN